MVFYYGDVCYVDDCCCLFEYGGVYSLNVIDRCVWCGVLVNR